MTAPPGPASYLLERAWVDGAVRDDVLVEIEDARFTSVTPDWQSLRLSGVATPEKRTIPRLTGETGRVPGLTIPGLANAHSHAFHRALRGRTQRGRGTFWTWREQMYALAARLDPDSYHRLARATFKEMIAAGITSVGEFHYLHHQPDGTPYDDPNAMGQALVEAAREAGIRIALLDTCYLAAGFGEPPAGVQRRFDDGDAERWAERASDLDRLERADGSVVLGAAVHSVRAVPAEQLPTVVDWAGSRQGGSRQARSPVGQARSPVGQARSPVGQARSPEGAPLHVHLSEQTAENDACIAAYGATPTQLLADHGVLGDRTTVVHATHLTDDDLTHLGSTRSYACFCPTTERDLADGVGPSRALRAAGARLTLGSDSHAVIDLFEEMRAVELDERLVTRARGHWSAAELLSAATATGQLSLGFAGVGAIAVGHRADLVTIDTTSPRTAGTGGDEQTAVFAATAADVIRVMVDGRVVIAEGDRADIGRELDAAIEELWT